MAGEAYSEASIGTRTHPIQPRALRWRACTYNCQSLVGWRNTGLILSGLSCALLGLQGTKLAPRSCPGACPARYEQNWKEEYASHWIAHWGRPPGSPANDCRGVALALEQRRLPRRYLKRIEAAEGDLQGRGGFVRMRRTGWCAYDLGIFVLYFPCGRDAASATLYRRLLDWATAIRASLPARCEVLFLADGNAHVGLPTASDTCGRALIGGCGAQLENRNGALLRQWATEQRLQLLNTTWASGSGPTWCGGRRAAHRVDYVAVDIDTHLDVQKVWVDYSKAVSLQLSHSHSWLDHAPVMVEFTYRLWYPDDTFEPPATMTRPQADMLLRDTALRSELAATVEAALETNADVLESAYADRDIEAHWEAINRAVADSAAALLPALRRQGQRWEDPDAVRAEQAFLDQRAASVDERNRCSSATPLRLTFVAWREWWHLRIAWGHVVRARKTARAGWRLMMAGKRAQAVTARNTRELWRICYSMNGSGLRKRKRWNNTLPVSLPSVLQWLPLLSSAGPAGGQEMLQAWLGPLESL